MSKDEKHLHIKSATERKQTPLDNDTQSKNINKKSKPTQKKSKHKHDYQITNIEELIKSHSINLFNLTNCEYFIVKYKCSICDKEKEEWKRISINKWDKKYKDIYNKLKSKEGDN
jgi:hypothetical protein